MLRNLFKTGTPIKFSNYQTLNRTLLQKRTSFRLVYGSFSNVAHRVCNFSTTSDPVLNSEKFVKQLEKLNAAQKYKEVEKEFKKARKEGMKIPKEAWKSIMNAYEGLGNPKECYRTLQEIKAYGNPLDASLYDIVISCFRSTFNSNEATRVFMEMLDNGISPSIWSYLNVLRVCIQTSDVENGMKVLNTFRNQSVIPPDKDLYQQMIAMACVAGDSKMAAMFCRESFEKKAMYLPRSTIERAFVLTIQNTDYENVPSMYDLGNQYALRNFKFSGKQVPEDRQRKNLLSEGEMLRSIEAMAPYTFTVPIVKSFYDDLVTYYGTDGFHPLAFNAVLINLAKNKMPKPALEQINKLPPTWRIHDSISKLLAAAAATTPDYLDALYYHTVSERPIHIDSINVIIRASSNLKDIDRAFHTLLEIPSLELTPDIRSYNYVLEGILETGNMEGVSKILDLIQQEQNVKPDENTYELLVQTFLKVSQPMYAYQYLEGAHNYGVTPTYESFRLTVLDFVKSGDLGWAMDTSQLATKYGYPREELEALVNEGGGPKIPRLVIGNIKEGRTFQRPFVAQSNVDDGRKYHKGFKGRNSGGIPKDGKGN